MFFLLKPGLFKARTLGALGIGEGLRLGPEEVWGVKRSGSSSLSELKSKSLEQVQRRKETNHKDKECSLFFCSKSLLCTILHVYTIHNIKSRGSHTNAQH